jgi:hypothetical protein
MTARVVARRLPVLLLLVVAVAAPARGAVPAEVPLAAHRAAYDLTLASVQGGDTVAASGSMTYQVSDACTNWATQQQLRLRTVTRDGDATDLVSDYATLEGKNGRHLVFDMTQRANGTLTQQVRGEATMDPSGAGRIRYTLPHRVTVALPAGTLFPMAHTAAIIRAARAGLKSIAPTLFDGTGPDGAQDTYVTILGWHPPPSQSDEPALAALGSSHVHVAFFSRAPDTITPDYEAAMRYFDNGVSDQLMMDFGGFSMHGTLRTFTLLKRPVHC